jgi:hypothetical protein
MTADRKPLLAAIGFALLLGVGSGWVELPPGIDESGEMVVSWARAHRDAIAVQSWLVMLAWLPGGALLSLIHRRMTGAPAAAFLLGGALCVGLLAVGILLRLGLARHAADLTPASARLLADIEAYWGPLATIAIVLQAAALGIATHQGAFPGWLLPITAVLGLEQLVETLTILGDQGFIAPGGALNQVGAALFGIWVLAQGVAASRNPETSSTAPRLVPQ